MTLQFATNNAKTNEIQQTMKTLDTQFKYGGFNFTQLARKGQVALFQKSKPPINGKSYEVVIIQQHKACHSKGLGKDFPATEAMPTSEQWGVQGWSYNDLPRAQAKFESLAVRSPQG